MCCHLDPIYVNMISEFIFEDYIIRMNDVLMKIEK
jgi:hypothetical protein